MRIKHQIFWLAFGTAYALAMRVLFQYAPHFMRTEIVSIAFMLGTPIAVGAIVVYGLRDTKPSIVTIIVSPWLAILLALLGSVFAALEGAVCIALASPLFFAASSVGGLAMGLILRWTKRGGAALNSVLVLPIFLLLVEPGPPQGLQLLEERASIEVAARPDRIWEEILNARDIRKEELPASFVHWIGVPRPVEGINTKTSESEVRHSKWERGVSFSALVVERIENLSITWRYKFTADSFPAGSLDDHVKIGGDYFDLHDTTFNLVPIAENLTRLEIISHFRVTTNINFYGVPVAKFIAKDFMSTILHLYKLRSER